MRLAAKHLVRVVKQRWDVACSTRQPVVVPANQRKLVPLPARRLESFREVLLALIQRATEQQRQPPTNSTEASPDSVRRPMLPILREACGTCRGHCCFPGNATALLTVDTVARFMRTQPRLSPQEVLEAYLSKLPPKSFDQSCFYHSEAGCTLPRPMRSDKCDEFYCDNLKAMCGVDASDGWMIIATSGKTPARFSLVESPRLNRSDQPRSSDGDADGMKPC